jgi:hypothetical protein
MQPDRPKPETKRQQQHNDKRFRQCDDERLSSQSGYGTGSKPTSHAPTQPRGE